MLKDTPHMSKKTKYLVFFLSLLVLAAAALLFILGNEDDSAIVFFSGAGMKAPASEIARNFTDLTGIPVHVHFEGSAVLRQYIETYDDADIYMSGDKKNMDILKEKGFVREPVFIAWHIPSILIPPENRNKIRGLNDLAKNGVRFVMSNPSQASLGRLVNNTLSRHPKGDKILNNAAVFGSNSQDDLRLFWTLYKKGEVDAVIEWDVMAYAPEGKGLMIVPFEEQYEIRDPLMIGLLTTSRNPDRAGRFLDYFRTEGVKIFKAHGYTVEAGK